MTKKISVGHFHLLAIAADCNPKDKDREPLKTPVSNAEALADVLQQKYGFLEKNINRIYSDRATKSQIILALRSLPERIGPDDSLVIYYDGHGAVDNKAGEGYWRPHGSEEGDPSTWLYHSEVLRHIRDVEARHILFIIDSCFAGAFFQTKGRRDTDAPVDVKLRLLTKSREAIASSSFHRADDEPVEGHSPFAYYLLGELQQNTSQYLLPEQLCERIKDNVRENSRERQEVTCRPLLYMGGRTDSSFVFLLHGKQEDGFETSAAASAVGGDLDAGQTSNGIFKLAELFERAVMAQDKARRDDESRLKDFNQDVGILMGLKSRCDSKVALGGWHTILRKWSIDSEEIPIGDVCILRKMLGIPFLTEDIDGTEMSYTWIPPTEGRPFVMGSAPSDLSQELDECPTHRVRISKGFWLGITPVTQAQYQSLIGDNPSEFKELYAPVEKVRWASAREFCKKLESRSKAKRTYRLPSEAEWEYACRCFTKTPFSFGTDVAVFSDFGWCKDNSGGKTHAVKQKLPNAWGLYDMHGNVWEWCHDYYNAQYYSSLPPVVDDPGGPKNAPRRTLRGGAFDDDAVNCRSARRGHYAPGDIRNRCGFRVLRED